MFSVSGCRGDRLAVVPVVSPASSSRLPTPPASPSLVPLFLVHPCPPASPCYSFVRPAPAASSLVRFVMVRMSVLGDALKTLSNAEKRGKRQVMLRPSSKVVIKFLQIMQKHGTLAAHCRDLGALFFSGVGGGVWPAGELPLWSALGRVRCCRRPCTDDPAADVMCSFSVLCRAYLRAVTVLLWLDVDDLVHCSLATGPLCASPLVFRRSCGARLDAACSPPVHCCWRLCGVGGLVGLVHLGGLSCRCFCTCSCHSFCFPAPLVSPVILPAALPGALAAAVPAAVPAADASPCWSPQATLASLSTWTTTGRARSW